MENRTADAILALQEEITSLSKVVLQNWVALDTLLASQGGVCSVINDSYCSYIGQSGRITTDLKMWKQVKIFHEVAQDDTYWGFEKIWENIMGTQCLLIGTAVFTCIGNRNGFDYMYNGPMILLVLQSLMNYEEWKRNKIKHQAETGKYFRKL